MTHLNFVINYVTHLNFKLSAHFKLPAKNAKLYSSQCRDTNWCLLTVGFVTLVVLSRNGLLCKGILKSTVNLGIFFAECWLIQCSGTTVTAVLGRIIIKLDVVRKPIQYRCFVSTGEILPGLRTWFLFTNCNSNASTKI